MNVVVLRYGMGNTDSVARAIEECGGRAHVTQDPAALSSATHVILPGVGAFTDGMRHVVSLGLDDALRREVVEQGIPLLGVCLGMQLLATSSEEGKLTSGLDLIPGRVKRLVASDGDRIPHVGWNEVASGQSAVLFQGLPARSNFYFVHSYHFVPVDPDHESARTPYCGGFTSAVAKGTVYGVQFHPEKSQRAGFQVLRNFLAL